MAKRELHEVTASLAQPAPEDAVVGEAVAAELAAAASSSAKASSLAQVDLIKAV